MCRTNLGGGRRGRVGASQGAGSHLLLPQLRARRKRKPDKAVQAQQARYSTWWVLPRPAAAAGAARHPRPSPHKTHTPRDAPDHPKVEGKVEEVLAHRQQHHVHNVHELLVKEVIARPRQHLPDCMHGGRGGGGWVGEGTGGCGGSCGLLRCGCNAMHLRHSGCRCWDRQQLHSKQSESMGRPAACAARCPLGPPTRPALLAALPQPTPRPFARA